MAIRHPIEPIYDEQTKVLILGSFPSVKSREQGFFYGHPQNRFWRVLSAVLGCACPNTIEEKTKMLKAHGIAVWDVIASCNIKGSSDASIKDVVPNDLERIRTTGQIRAVYCNGSAAFSLYEKYILPKYKKMKGCAFATPIKLPSTSPANAIWKERALIGAWSRIMTACRRKNIENDYYSLSDYAMDAYGKKLYRLSLDGGFTCPNRDGKIDTHGCIFCDAGGAGDFGGGGKERRLPIAEQLENQKQLIAPKLPKTKPVGYIAYFQSFTGTYAPIEYLRKQYEEAIKDPQVKVLSIATRPDCLGEDVLVLLQEMNQKIPVWIELGLQTSNEKTARYIRRGYDRKVYETAVRHLNEIGISQIITHIILGLPGEREEDMKKSVSYAISCGTTGLKLQLLHVLENTDLACDYENGLFEVLSFEDYIRITKECVALIPPDVVAHRLTGDGNKRHLIAPLWSADKKRVINAMKK